MKKKRKNKTLRKIISVVHVDNILKILGTLLQIIKLAIELSSIG